MRQLPPTRKLDPQFGEETFPGTATLLFEYADGQRSERAQQITVFSGRQGTWVLDFCPARALPAGSKLAFAKIENEFRFAWRHQDYWPDALEYTSVEDPSGQPLPFESDTCLKSRVAAIVTLPRDWAAGELVRIRLGDRRFGGAGCFVWPATYECARIAAGVLLPGEAAYRQVPEATVAARVVPCPPVKRYHAFAPSNARPGEMVRVIAMPVDINGNPMEGGPVQVLGAGGAAALRPTGFEAIQLAALVPTDAQRTTRLLVADVGRSITAWTNPIRVLDEAPYHVYWGEFHWHGYDADEINVLNADTHPEKAFRYGRDATGLDFSGVGSHIFRQAPQAVHQWWELYREAARKVDEEGRYVPFLGCEWRDRELEGGDRNLIWRDLDALVPDPTWKIDRIYELFRGQPMMVTPHVGGTIAMPYKHDPDVERLCEMTSGHGNFEWFAQAYLSKGYRVGLIGGSDGHRAAPGHPRMVSAEGGRFVNTLRRRDAGWYGGPLLAVMAERLDRESLWEAFRQRRTYASTGARALLDFRVNGAPMGAEIEAQRDVQIEVRVDGAALIEQVTLIRDQQRLHRWEGGSLAFAASLIDRPPDGPHYYYVRVEQQDGELLWSSPVWVDSSCGGPVLELPAWNQEDEVNLAAIGENAATPYLDDLLHYLRTEENAEAFRQLTPIKLVKSPMGEYAVFYGYMRERKVRIHWFHEFEVPRIRFEIGWAQYGVERIVGQPWAKPLFENQDRMG